MKKRLQLETLETRQVLNGAPVLLQQFQNSDWRSVALDTSQERMSLVRVESFDLADKTVLAVDDFTADGVDDVLVQWPDGSLRLQANDGSRLFQLPWGDGAPLNAEVLKVADVDNDGLNDVVSFDRASGNIWVSLNSATGFTSEVWSNFTPRTDWLHLFVDDFDGDGRIDVLGGESGGGWFLAKNVETTFNNFSWGRVTTFPWVEIVSGDFNGDGLADVSARASDNTWWTWLGAVDRLQAPSYWGHWKMTDNWHDVQVADFNNDGLDDIIGRGEDGRLRVGTAMGDRFQTWTWSSGWVHAADWTNMQVVDLTGDGLPEQLGRAQDGTWWYAENLGNRFANRFWTRHGGPTFVSTNFTREHPIDLGETFKQFAGVAGTGSEVDISVTTNSNNQLVIIGDNVDLLGVNFQSASGSLIPITDDESDPFEFVLESSPTQVTLATIFNPVSLNGTLTLDVGWNFGTGVLDLVAEWGSEFDDGFVDVRDTLDGGRPLAELINLSVSNRSLYFQLFS